MLHVSWLFSTVHWAIIYIVLVLPGPVSNTNCSLGGPYVKHIGNLTSSSGKFVNYIHISDYLLTYLLTYLLAYLLHRAESF